jgi:hypothetical protein
MSAMSTAPSTFAPAQSAGHMPQANFPVRVQVQSFLLSHPRNIKAELKLIGTMTATDAVRSKLNWISSCRV